MFGKIVLRQVFKVVPLAMVLASLAGGANAGASSPAQGSKFADPAFERVWQRTDLPVANGTVARTWLWGPKPGESLQEAYQTSSGGVGQHFVQYFDKARMEINDPSADHNSPWYVTNGLLTVELIAGEPTTGGPTAHAPRPPAEIPLASDTNDANAPTYKSFRAVADVPGNEGHQAQAAVGQAATATINRDGQVGSDPTKASYGAPVKYAYYEPATHHNIAAAFWDFLNSTGPVYDNGVTKVGALSQPWFYATGYPISEAYWSKANIIGKPRDVLIQAFQRRVLTYMPDNPAGWQVQMGNIGQHYYQWRYGGQPAPTPAPVPVGKLTGRIVFTSDRVGGHNTIFTMAPDGTDVRQVATTPGENSSPRYAAYGQSIAYMNVPARSGGPSIVIMFTTDAQSSAGAPMGATTVPAWDSQSEPAYSPDGLSLVFSGHPSGDKRGLFVANLASAAPVVPVRRLTSGDSDSQPVWSPDGKRIAYSTFSNVSNSQIWVINSDGSDNHPLTKAISGQFDMDPAWSPDGRRLLYATGKGTDMMTDIVSISLDGIPGPKIVGGDNSSERHPSYSPDGNWITFSSDKTGSYDIYITPADGSQWIDITNSPFMDVEPSWGK